MDVNIHQAACSIKMNVHDKVLFSCSGLKSSITHYHVSVEPMAHVDTGDDRANVTLLYNTPYNVSVVADICD